MSFADLESAIALSDKGLLSPNSFKNVVRRVVLSRGAKCMGGCEKGSGIG